MITESTTQRQTWAELSGTSTLFRCNTGKAWVSGMGPKGVKRFQDGTVNITAARPIAMGLGYMDGQPVVGTADLLGWTPITITQEMVGRTVAVYTEVECKRSKGGRLSPDQAKRGKLLSESGAIYVVSNDPIAAKQAIANWIPPV